MSVATKVPLAMNSTRLTNPFASEADAASNLNAGAT